MNFHFPRSSIRKHSAVLTFGLLAVVAFTSRSLVGQEKAHPIVLGFERFYREIDEDALDEEIAEAEINAGLLLLGELNCASCHEADDQILKQFVLTKSAPKLDNVGARLQSAYFVKMLSAPHDTKPGTTMPDLLGSLPAAERNQTAIELAAFLARGKSPSVGGLSQNLVKQGKKLFETIGCLACHDRQEEDAKRLTDSIPLGDLGAKFSAPSLEKFLRDPTTVRPSARMPHMNLNDKEGKAITSYLLRGMKIDANINFKYYTGNWKTLPDFAKLKPKSSGRVAGFDLASGKGGFGFVFSGFLQIEKEGKYKLHLASDDGSRLIIDGEELVNVDGIHPTEHKDASLILTKGSHEIVVEYFEGGGQRELIVEIEGNGLSRQSVATLITPESKKADKSSEESTEKPSLDLSPEMAARGRKHFATLGCANCHQGEVRPAENNLLSPPRLAKLGAGGCLAEAPAAGLPNYRLTQRQKKVIQSALAALKEESFSNEDIASNRFIHRKMLSMNCFSCHLRDDFGGPSKEREEAFTGTQLEMGAEGLIPPILTGVGAKLTSGQLKKVIETGHKDRPYMLTRMPRFGGEGAELAKLIEKVDLSDELWTKWKPIQLDPETSVRRLKLHGRKFAGADMMQCIKCHQFGKHKATGIQALSLTTMKVRLREEWFVEYMLKPARFRPGTRMPDSWPGGKTFYKDILNADPRLQAYSIWAFLSDGDKAQIPPGLGGSKMELIANDDTRIYRNFIEGAGSRAIGIGFPEKVNFAFDANQNRLALIWQGSFIDAARHWSGRGQGYQPPLGDNVLPLNDKVSFAKLESESEPWPNGKGKDLGVRFKGYRLNKDRHPIFQYKFDQIQVEDLFVPIPAAGKDDFGKLQRTLTVSGGGKGIFYRAAVAGNIETLDGDWYRIDDWKMRMKSHPKPIIRESNGKKELIVPIESGTKKTTIEQLFEW